MRTENRRDLELVERGFGYLSRSWAQRARELKVGEAILAGKFVAKPCCIHILPRRSAEGGRNLQDSVWIRTLDLTEAVKVEASTELIWQDVGQFESAPRLLPFIIADNPVPGAAGVRNWRIGSADVFVEVLATKKHSHHTEQLTWEMSGNQALGSGSIEVDSEGDEAGRKCITVKFKIQVAPETLSTAKLDALFSKIRDELCNGMELAKQRVQLAPAPGAAGAPAHPVAAA